MMHSDAGYDASAFSQSGSHGLNDSFFIVTAHALALPRLRFKEERIRKRSNNRLDESWLTFSNGEGAS